MIYKTYLPKFIFRLVRYEDMVRNPLNFFNSTFEFLKLELSETIEKKICTLLNCKIRDESALKMTVKHAHKSRSGNPYSTRGRDSKAEATQWVSELSWPEVEEIQNICANAMQLWGYKQFNATDDLLDADPLAEFIQS